ncbi:hypothetical protein EX30DRAFT_341449 [Ascodesmis nigricans]|uniref:Uncharacterized protein n=1 Tax=Ascodesmis nigricans TaxID=341454 RepID=A0A4S2MVH4_9PEZI|nr:hypothetical protein EX30DRAFT_341449 [Ascodesmis nigricans]
MFVHNQSPSNPHHSSSLTCVTDILRSPIPKPASSSEEETPTYIRYLVDDDAC